MDIRWNRPGDGAHYGHLVVGPQGLPIIWTFIALSRYRGFPED